MFIGHILVTGIFLNIMADPQNRAGVWLCPKNSANHSAYPNNEPKFKLLTFMERLYGPITMFRTSQNTINLGFKIKTQKH